MNSIFTENKDGIIGDLAARSITVNHLPFYYHIHLHMPCNQRCIMCKPDGKHPKDTLPFQEFVNFFEAIKPVAEHLTLIGGEPLIYPWIGEVVDLIAEHQIAVTINTNATMLDETLVEKLLRLHELHLKCSIDAATPETYFKIRGTDMFERVTTNLLHFAAEKKGKLHMKQILVYVVMRENLGEVLPFIEFARSFEPDRIEFHPVRHVSDWEVSNRTGWLFDGREQSCEFFQEEYNDIMQRAAAACAREGIAHETIFI